MLDPDWLHEFGFAVSAIIGAVAGLVGAMAGARKGAQSANQKLEKKVDNVEKQVTNNHDTNMRDDLTAVMDEQSRQSASIDRLADSVSAQRELFGVLHDRVSNIGDDIGRETEQRMDLERRASREHREIKDQIADAWRSCPHQPGNADPTAGNKLD